MGQPPGLLFSVQSCKKFRGVDRVQWQSLTIAMLYQLQQPRPAASKTAAVIIIQKTPLTGPVQ